MVKSSEHGLMSTLLGGVLGVAVLLVTAAGLYLALSALHLIQPIAF